MTTLKSLLVALVFLLVTGSAFAQDDAAAAEVLFREGQELFDAGKAAEACPKFEASYALDEGLGTLTNLARCYETIGKTASAWAKWLDLKALATRAGHQDRAEIAATHIAALEPKLVRMTIEVPEPVAGLTVMRADLEVKPELYGVAVAVDPGVHRIAVRAPGHESWERDVTMTEGASPVVVVVPKLTPLAPDPDPPPVPVPAPAMAPPHAMPPKEPEAPTPALAIAGGVVAGLGVVGWAIAGGLSAAAASSWSDADCQNGVCPTADQQALSEDANRQADVATGFVIAGSILAAAGVTLVLVGVLDEEHVGGRGLSLRF